MPALLTFNGIRFFFYSNENNEPIHVHMTKGSAASKVWPEPVIEVAFQLLNLYKAENVIANLTKF